MLHFGEVKIATVAEHHAFEVEVYLSDLDPSAIRVELYADGVAGGGPVRQEMKIVRPLIGVGVYAYGAQVSAARPASDYTARVIPQHSGVAVPLEASQVLWQR
jgi:starch phosphorylase